MESVARAANHDEDEAFADHEEARTILETSAEEEGDFDRLMEEAKTKLEGVETRRRFSAISHLKAAVAATLADRRCSPPTSRPSNRPSEEEISLYRDDLSKAVRPRRPASEGSATRRPSADLRPTAGSGLAQRVDNPEGAGTPRVPSSARAASPPATSPSTTTRMRTRSRIWKKSRPKACRGFAEFAERLGASTMTVFSKPPPLTPPRSKAASLCPHILRKVEFVLTRGDYNREDGLRSFGMLLRQGKIQKVARGQFAVSGIARQPN